MPVTDGVGASEFELWPTHFLEETLGQDAIGSKRDVALIILNSPIASYEYFDRLYRNACFRLCADGGANRLHDLLISSFPEKSIEDALRHAPPDGIHGDLDSLNPLVRRRFEQLGVEVSKDGDLYSTDFGKAVKMVVERMPDVKDVLVFGSIGGRVDQGIGLLHEFYREQKFRHPGISFWLFSEASISTILSPGSTVIHTPLRTGLIKRNVGILPLYGPAVISTQGLEWDVEDWPTGMGGQVSTSNHVIADRITVKTDNHVLFTVQNAVSR